MYGFKSGRSVGLSRCSFGSQTRTSNRRACPSRLRAALGVAVAGVIASSATPALAADGSWTNPAGGAWSDPANWLGGVVADAGVGNFGTIDITGDVGVVVDAPRALTSLTFSDTVPTTAGRWILGNGGNAANTLTVSGNTAVGQGTLSLTGALTTGSMSVSVGGTGNPSPAVSVDGGTLIASGLSTINAGTGSGRFVLNSGSAAFNGGLRTSNADGAIIQINGGTFTATDLNVQRNGTASSNTLPLFTSGLIFTGGTSTVGTIRVGTNNSWGAMSVSGGSVTATGAVTLGNQTSGGRGGGLQVTGGVFNVNDTTDGIIMGRRNGTTDNVAIATFSGGVSTVEKFTMGYDAATTTRSATVNVSGTGELYVGSGGFIKNTAAGHIAVVNFSGGTVGAKADWFSVAGVGWNVTGTGATFKAADAANNPHNITINGSVTGAGTINKTGGGSLTLGGANWAGGTSDQTGNFAVSEGTLVFDQAGNGTYGGLISGAGAVTKAGAGTFTLSNAQAYTGATTVAGGTLAINGAQATSGVTVLKSAALALNGNATVNALTLGTSGGDTQTLRVNTGSGVNSLGVLTTNALIANGTTTIAVGSVGLNPGTYSVLDYSGTIGGNGFSGFTLGTLPARVVGNLVNNTANTSIDLNITGVDFPRWMGSVNGNWDINATQNWKEVSTGNTTVYLENSIPGDQVVFDDAATGTTNVNIVTPVSPAMVTVNNAAKNYTFSGAKISGPGQLLKQGAASLTLSNVGNDYTGGTTVQGGTLLFATPNALPTAGNVTINGGTIDMGGNSQDLSGAFALLSGAVANGTINKMGTNYAVQSGTVSATLGGAVGLDKTTTGTVVMSSMQTYTGLTTVSAGTLQLGDGVALGAPAGAIANSGTVIFNNGTDQTWNSNITGTAASIVKTGAGTLTVGGQNEGNVTVNAGKIVAFASGNNSRLARGGTLTINSGGTVELQGINALGLGTGTLPPRVVLNSGGTLTGADGSESAIYNGTFAGGVLTGQATSSITLRGDYIAIAGTTSTISVPHISMNNGPVFDVDTGANVNITGAMVGSDSLAKSGAGTMTLTGANTYSGTTTVQAGTLKLGALSQEPVFGGATVTAPAGANVLGGKLVLSYAGGTSPAAQVRSILAAGFAETPAKFATGLIRSTTMAADRTLGYADNTSTSEVTVAYTVPGDANLDFLVSFADLVALAQNYNGSNKGWAEGDFNYDNTVGFPDLVTLAQNYNQAALTGQQVAVVGASFAADFALAQALALVPEPVSLMSVAGAAMTLLRRHRR